MKYTEQQERQIGEVNAAIRELDAGLGVDDEQVVVWLKSWGTARNEVPAPLN